MKRLAFIRRFALGVMAPGMLMDALVRGNDPLSNLPDDMIVAWVDPEPIVPRSGELTEISVASMDGTSERYVKRTDGDWDAYLDGEYLGVVPWAPYKSFRPAL